MRRRILQDGLLMLQGRQLPPQPAVFLLKRLAGYRGPRRPDGRLGLGPRPELICAVRQLPADLGRRDARQSAINRTTSDLNSALNAPCLPRTASLLYPVGYLCPKSRASWPSRKSGQVHINSDIWHE